MKANEKQTKPVMNKNWQVLKRLGGNWSPSFEREFDELEDAKAFCELCNKSKDGWYYYVVHVY